MLVRACAQALLLLVLTCGLSFADETRDAELERSASVTNVIPGKYALAIFMDAEPETDLDKDAYLRVLHKLQQEAGVRVMQMAVYDSGKRPGEGVRAVAELILGQEEPTVAFTEARSERMSRSFEKYMTYTVNPGELFDAYVEGGDKAALYKNQPLIVDVPIMERLEKDAQGRPYIHIRGEGSDMLDLVILLDPDDPFLPQIYPGSSVIVRGFAVGYERPSVIMPAEVIMVNGETRS
jgi:hypothetical protein